MAALALCARAGRYRHGIRATRLAVDYPSIESLMILQTWYQRLSHTYPTMSQMDLTHLRLTGMASVGQQYGAVGLPYPMSEARQFLP